MQARRSSPDVLVEIIEAAWTGLGFDVIADEAFVQLVLARLAERQAKSGLGDAALQSVRSG